jgi:hypothetical protein
VQNRNAERVLKRKGARELNQQELDALQGALRTAAKCTFTVNPFTGSIDSDTQPC